ncbi:MAG TPA: hypothetical protein VGM08_04100 [Candidatus Saccharimonadales bacterium]|jgi:hypothetical protein
MSPEQNRPDQQPAAAAYDPLDPPTIPIRIVDPSWRLAQILDTAPAVADDVPVPEHAGQPQAGTSPFGFADTVTMETRAVTPGRAVASRSVYAGRDSAEGRSAALAASSIPELKTRAEEKLLRNFFDSPIMQGFFEGAEMRPDSTNGQDLLILLENQKLVNNEFPYGSVDIFDRLVVDLVYFKLRSKIGAVALWQKFMSTGGYYYTVDQARDKNNLWEELYQRILSIRENLDYSGPALPDSVPVAMDRAEAADDTRKSSRWARVGAALQRNHSKRY